MYKLRDATVEDFEFLFELHRLTMRDYVHATFGWDDAAQREYFTRKFLQPPVSILIVDGQDNGSLTIESRAEDEHLAGIEIHPRVQRRGIGAAIVREVIARAAARRVPARLRVLKVNVGARRLYQRLGFVVVGETETHYDMRCG